MLVYFQCLILYLALSDEEKDARTSAAASADLINWCYFLNFFFHFRLQNDINFIQYLYAFYFSSNETCMAPTLFSSVVLRLSILCILRL